MSDNLKNLFTPVKISSMELKNRVVMPAIATSYGNKDSTVSDRLISYLEMRAKGGAGLIITEVCAIDPRGKGFGREIGVWDDSFIPGLSRLTDAIHKYDTKIALQLHHAGRETMKAVTGKDPEAPSDLPSVVLNQPVEPMTIERVREIVKAYASGALRAKQAGFDAVEIHGAHGYLLTQFLSPFSNTRTDEYGGSDENRARILIEIIKAVREKVGADFPVLVRISADECIKNGYTIDFTKWLSPQLKDAGADAIHVSVGVYSTPGFLTIASEDTPEGFNLERAAEIKKTVSLPIIGVGRITDPRMADEAIANGNADLISMGRQFLADPEFLIKAKEGRWKDIRQCLGCNQGCIERLSFEFKSTTCSINPECGREIEDIYKKADLKKKIWIIGGGPSGLSAALAAAKRGHDVSIFEKESSLGGQLISASKPPNKSGFYKWVEWAQTQLESMGVSIKYNTEVTEAMLEAGKPDMAVLAAGAISVTPPIDGINNANVFDARDVLTGKEALKGPVVIMGAGYVGMETSDFCIARGVGVTLVEMAKYPPVNSFSAHGYWLHRRLKKSGGALMLETKVTSIKDNSVFVIKDNNETEIKPAAMVIKAFGSSSERRLAASLQKLGIPFTEAGDVIKPRRLLEAVHEGDNAGVEA